MVVENEMMLSTFDGYVDLTKLGSVKESPKQVTQKKSELNIVESEELKIESVKDRVQNGSFKEFKKNQIKHLLNNEVEHGEYQIFSHPKIKCENQFKKFTRLKG